MQEPSLDPDTIFAEIIKDLPPETESLAREFKAFARARKIKTVAELFRIVLLFAGLDQSEREIAANVVLVNPEIESLTDQSVHDRLKACLPWLQALLPKLIERAPLPVLPSGIRVLVIDASDITAPGQTKVSWRVHLMMDLVSLQPICVHLTDVHTGETLLNFDFGAGEVVLADRGYSHRKGVAHLIDKNFDVDYHPGHVWRILRQLNWSVQLPVGRALERNEGLIDDWRRNRWPAIKKKLKERGGRSSSSTKVG